MEITLVLFFVSLMEYKGGKLYAKSYLEHNHGNDWGSVKISQIDKTFLIKEIQNHKPLQWIIRDSQNKLPSLQTST